MRGSLKLNLSRRRLQGAKKTYCARVPQLRRIRLRNILVIFHHWRSIFYSLPFMILCCFPPEIYVIPPKVLIPPPPPSAIINYCVVCDAKRRNFRRLTRKVQKNDPRKRREPIKLTLKLWTTFT